MTGNELETRLETIRVSKKNGQIPSADEEVRMIGQLVLDFYLGFVDDDKFAVRIREFVLLFHDMYDTLKIVLSSICDDEEKDETIRFYAFYSMYTMMRRNQNYRAIGQLITRYRKDFSDEPRFDIVLSTYYRFTGEDFSPADIEKAVFHAEKAFNNPRLRNMQGVKAHYAEMIGVALTNEIYISDSQKAKAEDAIEDEMRKKQGYGKYYYIRARLNLVSGKYKEALRDIGSAIEYEDKGSSDAHLRIPEYIGLRFEIKQKMKEELIEKKIEKLGAKTQLMSDELNENRTKIIEYITFFSGIIAFIVSTIQVSLNAKSFGSYVGLLLVMSALLILSFTSFMVITHGLERKGVAFGIVLIPVIGLLVLGILIGFGWSIFASGVQ